MSVNESYPVESLETWLSCKPYWEKYVWKLNFEKESLTEDDIDRCYQHLSEYIGIVPAPPGEKTPISFKSKAAVAEEASAPTSRVRLLEINGFIGVNAIPRNCSVKCGSNLTLIYGLNGSGKSGVSRLLCNACFSRGDREILPNLKDKGTQTARVGAEFILDVGAQEPVKIDYRLGDFKADLKRFSVFDGKSVRIHLDQPNRVNFVPARIRIFDKVADTIAKLERKLDREKAAKRKDNPFSSMFLDQNEVSSTASFCRSISALTNDADFLKHASFDVEKDEATIVQLRLQIDEKKKLDVPKKKSQLIVEQENLTALKSQLQKIVDLFTSERLTEINKLADDILEKRNLVEGLSVSIFDDGVSKTIGSVEWKSLIAAAKALFEKEKAANEGREPSNCLLCHQELHNKETELFTNYWKFLESKAEAELLQLKRAQVGISEVLQDARRLFPQFLSTDAGIKVLSDDDPTYLTNLKSQFLSLFAVLNDWILKVSDSKKVDRDSVPAVSLDKIDTLIAVKSKEESTLADPSVDIDRLNAQLVALKHKKLVTAVKDSALEHLSWLRWLYNTSMVSFPGVKGAITKKRTEAFQAGVATDYIKIFNEELAALGCSSGLALQVSGDQGNTVKEYKFEFAKNYNPSQILSEGEQNGCALADFLTETQIDQDNCGIIFDDPVTSLDQVRKDKIAKRLVAEAAKRQVIIFTHDIVFMSLLVKHAGDQTPIVAHWMRNINGTPGCVEENTSPKLASLTRLKSDSCEAVKEFEALKAKEQEHALGVALDYLRSACEALIEEILFAKTIQRYDDHIKVMNLEEAVFDQSLALKIVDLHGQISEALLAHNRSDLQRENPLALTDLSELRRKFDELEAQLKDGLKTARRARDERKSAKAGQRAGW